jgi:hypothetical protein
MNTPVPDTHGGNATQSKLFAITVTSFQAAVNGVPMLLGHPDAATIPVAVVGGSVAALLAPADAGTKSMAKTTNKYLIFPSRNAD